MLKIFTISISLLFAINAVAVTNKTLSAELRGAAAWKQLIEAINHNATNSAAKQSTNRVVNVELRGSDLIKHMVSVLEYNATNTQSSATNMPLNTSLEGIDLIKSMFDVINYTATNSVLYTVVDNGQYTLPEIVLQSPTTNYPVSFSAFSPIVESVAISESAPEINEWTKQAEPGDAFALTAENGIDSIIVYGEGLTALGTLNTNDGRAYELAMPTELPANDVYLLWATNSSGYSAPIAFNAAEAWWVGPYSSATGETFAVYGQNLTLGGSSCWAYVDGSWIESTSANPYRALFTVPALTNGTYDVYVHNGHGRKYGWSDSVELTVRDAWGWSEDTNNWKYVTAYGAVGDGVTDDTTAIKNAIAASYGTTCYFPAGTYLVSDRLDTKWGVRLKGAGMDQTEIVCASNWSATAEGMIAYLGLDGRKEIHDMTLDAGAGYIYNASVDQLVRFTDLDDGTGFGLYNVRFDYRDCGATDANSEPARLDRLINGEIFGCEFYANGAVSLSDANNVLFSNCTFFGMNDIGYMVSPARADQMAFIDCMAQPLDDSDSSDGTGWSQGRFVTTSCSSGGARNFYFAGNIMTNMAVRPGFSNQNTGEKYMAEHGHTVYRGNPVSVTSNTVYLSDFTTDYTGETIVIVGGRGKGQYRRIESCSSGTYTLTENWRVEPDTNSVLVIGEYVVRHAIYNNYFDGRADVTDDDNTATTGVEPFGAAMSLIVDGNTFNQLRKGVSTWSMPSEANNGQNPMNPSFWGLVQDSTFKDCRYAVENAHAIFGISPTEDDTTIMGLVYRDNTASGTVVTNVYTLDWNGATNNSSIIVYDNSF